MFELELVNVTISRDKVRKLIGNKFCEIPKLSTKSESYLIISFTIENPFKKSGTNCKKRSAICKLLLSKFCKICFGFYFHVVLAYLSQGGASEVHNNFLYCRFNLKT